MSHTIKKGIDLRELQAKFIQNRVTQTEKNMAELCRALTGYTLNCARLRDSSDHISQVLTYYSESETVSKSLSRGLLKLATVMTELGDIRDAEVKLLEEHILPQLAQYEDKCKYAKSEVSTIGGAFTREANRRKDCEKLRQRNMKNVQSSTQAETDYAKAQAEVIRQLKIVEEKMQVFEEQKSKDLKGVLQMLVVGQMRQHARGLELCTQGYGAMEDISEQEDLQSFLDILSEPENIHRLETVKKTTASNSSLNTIAGLFTTNNRAPQHEQQVTDAVVIPSHDIEDNNDSNEDEDNIEEDDSGNKTVTMGTSKPQPNSLVQRIKSLAN
uniref:Protein FAM92A1-B n=1 Tax=Cacopsylla melanoneura TaxID=428564 RepID=A0A8D9ESU7_9HEMI